ncbi:DUF4231 domain-containing protein [Halioxenophilus sp. WMMB6]|uniref:DUF4231 domain-containing protein n=1 Tax=Halioxenophilus sp. WMMB6 TaxID=3073815 RepID=UPI00295F4535|nr:DUF4231 domain-containing protein [Halioxenophilus sp. WMMB6]
MANRIQYRKRANFHVTAVRIDLECEPIHFRKWGDEQQCQPGDWLVNNGGDTYTVADDYFRQNYREIAPGEYEKIGAVWAEQAREDGTITTLEGKTQYTAGDYLVTDRPKGGDCWAVEKEKFERMYEPVTREQELSEHQLRYLSERLQGQITWYDRNATKNKNFYFLWQTVAIVSAALVPILSLNPEIFRYLIAICGALSAVCVGILTLFKYQENWVKFRSASEELKSHLAQYWIGTGPYQERRYAFQRLAENCENIVRAERGQWAQQFTPEPQNNDQDPDDDPL